jgi:hypothetical protein
VGTAKRGKETAVAKAKGDDKGEPKDAKGAKEAKETKGGKDSRGAKGGKETKGATDAKDAKEENGPTEAKEKPPAALSVYQLAEQARLERLQVPGARQSTRIKHSA